MRLSVQLSSPGDLALLVDTATWPSAAHLDALRELRLMHHYAHACIARVAREIRASAGSPNATGSMRLHMLWSSVRAWNVSVSKSATGSDIRNPVWHLYQTLKRVRANHKTSILGSQSL